MRVRATLGPSKSRPTLRSVAVFVCCGLAAAVLACNQEPAAPGALGGSLRAARSSRPDGSVLVTLYHSDGTTAASGYSVGVIDSETGEVYAGITNGSGTVSFNSLPEPGTYCVDALPVGSGTLTAKGSEVPPPDGTTLDAIPATATDAAVLSGPNGTSVQLDKANFLRYCTQTPPVELKNKNAVDVSLTLTSGRLLSADILGLSSSTTTSSNQDYNHGYLGIALQWSDLPDAWDPGHATDQNPLILLAANPASDSVHLPVDQTLQDPLVFESDFIPSNDLTTDTRLTGTLRFLLSGVSADGSLTVRTEPLTCSVDTVAESSTDGSPGKVELQPHVKQGYLADSNLESLPGAVAVWWHETGTGNVTFSLRDRTDSGTLTYQSTLACTDQGCSESNVTGTLVGTVDARSYAGSDEGTLRVTYTLQGLPPGDLEWSVSTSGDQIPDASKASQSSAYVSIPAPPATCEVHNNDDRWILGN